MHFATTRAKPNLEKIQTNQVEKEIYHWFTSQYRLQYLWELWINQTKQLLIWFSVLHVQLGQTISLDINRSSVKKISFGLYSRYWSCLTQQLKITWKWNVTPWMSCLNHYGFGCTHIHGTGLVWVKHTLPWVSSEELISGVYSWYWIWLSQAYLTMSKFWFKALEQRHWPYSHN